MNCLKLDAAEINLLLREIEAELIDSRFWHGDEYGNWSPTDTERKEVLYRILDELQPVQLQKLADGIEEIGGHLKRDESIVADDVVPLFLFGSHLAKHKKVISEVGDSLSLLGVRLFIAHESIRPTADFQQEIRKSLNEVHGGLIFFHDGFGASPWCDQEVGWLIGRDVPYFTLKYGKKPPHGFVAKDQALSVTERTTHEKVIKEIVEWVTYDPDLKPRFIDSLLISLSRSNLFSTTDSLWRHLRLQQGLTQKQIDFLLSATQDNYQIHGAASRVGMYEDGRGDPYPRVIWKFVQSQTHFNAQSEAAVQYLKSFSDKK